MPLPPDYGARVYAGVLGKMVGVYLGRPFEGWSHARIMAELGPVTGYVHDRFGQPLVVTDDDIAGTFTFVRALEEHGARQDLTAAEIGRTWLNTVVENRAIFWWGGRGTSTEHTAWLNLKDGVPAPRSGSAALNGATLAEQIGAQIFIDGWAMVAPGQPRLAARLAEQAARVSHDGIAVHAAMLIAAMEAEAFVAGDLDHLIETGLAVIPRDSPLAALVAEVRGWHARHADWHDTRDRIEHRYGDDRYPGLCHIVPNHALVLMALLYAPDDLHRALSIAATAGQDTDCNAGTVGCLLALKNGLAAFEGGPDWRGPLADRMLISSADGGEAITDAVRVTQRLVTLGHRLAGLPPPAPPKQGAPWHFSLPGSVQGFAAEERDEATGHVAVGHREGALALRFEGLVPGRRLAATTPTFAPPETPAMRTYDLMACPLLYPGQAVEAAVAVTADTTAPVTIGLRLRVYGRNDESITLDGPAETVSPGGRASLAWVLPDTGGQPIQRIGLVLSTAARQAAGCVLLDFLRWEGTPTLRLRRPDEPGTFWRRAWVDAVSRFSTDTPAAFRISQSHGEGLILHGTRDWRDYTVATTLTVHLGREAGLAARVQGLRRFYVLLLSADQRVRLVKVRDDVRTVLAERPFAWSLERPYRFAVTVEGRAIAGRLDGHLLVMAHDEDAPFAEGGIGLLVNEGALSTPEIRIDPPDTAAGRG